MTDTVVLRTAKPRRVRRGVRSARWTPTAFVAPAVILLFAITILPFIAEIVLSLLGLELTTPAPARWLGLKNFEQVLFHDPRFWNSIKVTGLLIAGGVGVELLLGSVLAFLINRLNRTRGVVTSLFLIPVMVAPVVSGMMWVMIYDDKFGPLNYLIQLLSFGKLHGAAWIADPSLALVSIMVADIWQWTPFVIMIVLAGLQSIPTEMYEAAEVDGSGYWSTLWFITLPMLLPVLTIGVLIRFMDSFKLFDLVYLITHGGPASLTETISYYTYIRGFKQFSIGYTAALAFVQLVIIIVAAKLFIGYLNRRRGETT